MMFGQFSDCCSSFVIEDDHDIKYVVTLDRLVGKDMADEANLGEESSLTGWTKIGWRSVGDSGLSSLIFPLVLMFPSTFDLCSSAALAPC